ncbi:hypothetical protein [Aquamicrobium defluvii]|uniref:hypothetical protein n=1 Tax=Aquamicrobium defluvii TaxID=69279 RepID=UPI00105E11FC|nr:hypothetical protein [Aquamicrobium defluvii]
MAVTDMPVAAAGLVSACRSCREGGAGGIAGHEGIGWHRLSDLCEGRRLDAHPVLYRKTKAMNYIESI